MTIADRLRAVAPHIINLVHFADVAAGEGISLEDAEGNLICAEDAGYGLWKALNEPDDIQAALTALFAALEAKDTTHAGNE